MTPKLLSPADVAAVLGISPRRVRAIAISRKRGRRVSGRWAFTKHDLDGMRIRVAGRPWPKKEG